VGVDWLKGNDVHGTTGKEKKNPREGIFVLSGGRVDKD